MLNLEQIVDSLEESSRVIDLALKEIYNYEEDIRTFDPNIEIFPDEKELDIRLAKLLGEAKTFLNEAIGKLD